MIRCFYIALLALFGAIIVHIILLFLYPILEQKVFWSEIEQIAPANQFTRLARHNTIIKISDPITILALCHFDLTNNPIYFHGEGNVPFWSFSIYDNKGNNLYSINDRTSPDHQLNLVLGDPIQIIDYKQTIADKEKKPVITQQNISKGFAILRILQPRGDWQHNIDDFLYTASCREVTD